MRPVHHCRQQPRKGRSRLAAADRGGRVSIRIVDDRAIRRAVGADIRIAPLIHVRHLGLRRGRGQRSVQNDRVILDRRHVLVGDDLRSAAPQPRNVTQIAVVADLPDLAVVLRVAAGIIRPFRPPRGVDRRIGGERLRIAAAGELGNACPGRLADRGVHSVGTGPLPEQ